MHATLKLHVLKILPSPIASESNIIYTVATKSANSYWAHGLLALAAFRTSASIIMVLWNGRETEKPNEQSLYDIRPQTHARPRHSRGRDVSAVFLLGTDGCNLGQKCLSFLRLLDCMFLTRVLSHFWCTVNCNSYLKDFCVHHGAVERSGDQRSKERSVHLRHRDVS